MPRAKAGQPIPVMDRNAFQRLVEEEVEKIPERFRKELHNVTFVVEDESPDGEELLGLFDGVPLGEQGSGPWELPGRILIFKKPTEREARESGLTVRQVIHDTIWHEVAHYFGMEEHEVLQVEDKRTRKQD